MRIKKKKLIGELLVESKVLNDDDLSRALEKQKSDGTQIGKVIISSVPDAEEAVTVALSGQLDIPMADLDHIKPSPGILASVSESLARKHIIFPLERTGDGAKIAMSDPLDLSAIEELTIRLSCEIEPVIASESRIMRAIEDHYSFLRRQDDAMQAHYPAPGKADRENIYARENAVKYGSKPPPVSKLVDTIINRAIRDRASDIHIEPEENNLRIRHRIDGVLFKVTAPSKKLERSIVSRIKIMAQLDISETRLPQEGRFKSISGTKPVEFRVSTFPTIYGESVVIRILNPDSIFAGLEQTGLCASALDNFRRSVSARQGIVVVTGPTGSGKTTTLYAALNMINSSQKNIVTIEDPVEYRLEYVRQTQVNLKTGLTFARGLRSMLRQDPDIIMVGEIRDNETAQIAIRAAMTGHLVLSTMHTNDSAGVVTRLMDLGVEPRLISSTLRGVLAQRLVRKICKNCKTISDKSEPSFYRGRGCLRCMGSGYYGRTGIFEYLQVDENVVEMILNGSGSPRISESVHGSGSFRSMHDDGVEKVRNGVTTLEELENII